MILFGFLSLFTGSHVRHVTEDQIVRKYSNEHFKRKDVKRILIWTPFLGNDIGELESQCLKRCNAPCEITLDKNDVSSVDAINFHLSELWAKYWSLGTRSIVELPSYRRPDQVSTAYNHSEILEYFHLSKKPSFIVLYILTQVAFVANCIIK